MRLLRVIIFLLLAGFAALAGYAYFGDMAADPQPMRVPVQIDLGSGPGAAPASAAGAAPPAGPPAPRRPPPPPPPGAGTRPPARAPPPPRRGGRGLLGRAPARAGGRGRRVAPLPLCWGLRAVVVDR
ncbi:hypothetical protein, partial [Paracoccus sanguinis]|uniref:hypothetical protein n=1 Tax=Paracoccus sanguinis TaxID=1545044 RepID=UPI00055A2E70